MAAPEVTKITPKAKQKKYRVQANTMIWNGQRRIRQGTVFDLEWDDQDDQTKDEKGNRIARPLPRSVEIVEEKAEEVVTLGKRERGNIPTNLAKDAPAPRGTTNGAPAK